MLHDYGKKRKHTPAQFELNRKFAHAYNPTDDSMEAGPGIYDNYKSQVNVYDETSVYTRLQARLRAARSQVCGHSQDRLT